MPAKNVPDQDLSGIASTSKKKQEKVTAPTATGKKINFAERQARNPLLQVGDKPSCPLGPSHFGFRMSREESLSTEDLFGTLMHHPPSHNPACPLPCSSTYDKEYPSLGGNPNDTSSHSGSVKQSSNAAFSSSTSAAASKFQGSLTEDLSRHLTGNQSSGVQNGFTKAEATKLASQPFNILTVSGGKKYQPPTMHGGPAAAPKISETKSSTSSSLLASSASPSVDSNLLPPTSPVGILSMPRPAGESTASSMRTSSAPSGSTDLGKLPNRSTTTANGFSSSGLAGTDVNSPISIISSFCSTTAEPNENNSAKCLTTVSSGTTLGANGTTVSNLLKLKLAGNNAPKIVSKPGQDATNPTKAASSTPQFAPQSQVAYPIPNSTDYPQSSAMSQSSGSSLRGPTAMGAMNMAPHLGPPSHHMPPALHLLPLPHQSPMPAQHPSLLPQHHPSQSQHPGMHRSGFYTGTGQKSSMNPNAPPFRPSGDGTMPQPHSDFDGGWDDEVTWAKDSDYAPQSSQHWSGFNPNAPPFVSKAAKAMGGFGMDPMDDEYHMAHLSIAHHPMHVTTSVTAPRYPLAPYPAGGMVDYEPPMAADYSSLSTSSRTSSYRSPSAAHPPANKGDPKAEPRKSKSLLVETPNSVRPMRPPGFEDAPGFAGYEGGSRRKARQPCLVCGEESTLECSTCAQIRKRLGVPLRTFFCSTEHQTQAWKQHHEVHLQHPLSGVPSLTKQRQQAILGKSGSDPGPSHEPFSGASSDGASEASDTLYDGDAANGAGAGEAHGAAGEESAARSMGDGSLTHSLSSEFSPTPASSSQSPEAPPDLTFGKYCAPHLFPIRSTASAPTIEEELEADGPPMAESELESIGNSILNDLDDMMMSGPFALSGPGGGSEELDPGPETRIVALS